jgi:hypothetical protein
MARGFKVLSPLAVAGVTAITLFAVSGSGEEVAAAGEVGLKAKREKGEKGEPSYKELAARNVARARRAFGVEDGEKTAPAEYLMQSAIVFAILDLADAVRSTSRL